MGRFHAAYNNGPRFSQLYEVSSGSMSGTTNTQVDVDFIHGLGVVPINAFGILRDGTWAGQVVCQWVTADATKVTFRFTNRGPNVAQAIYRFQLTY